MLLVLLFEIVLPLFLLYILISQIIIPALNERPLWPMFRKSPDQAAAQALRVKVSDLQDRTDGLRDLAALKKQEAALQASINEIDEKQVPDASKAKVYTEADIAAERAKYLAAQKDALGIVDSVKSN